MKTYTFLYFDKLIQRKAQLDINAETIDEAINIFKDVEPKTKFKVI